MGYKVLYRKYRPDNFENVVGQDYVVKMLRNAIVSGKHSHAYIFTGPRGTGKTSSAKIFAKAINCENPVDGSPCNKCSACLSFKESPDIIEIDAASNNGVDEIRELINNVKLVPSSLRYKVYIIDEVHMLTTSAFNALLLTLEEPPEHVIFILATTDIQNVPITILSRCQRFDFKPVSVKDIVSRLEYICNEEKIKISSDALNEIAIVSAGGMRDALGMLDQLSSNGDEITVDMVTRYFGSISSERIKALFNSIFSGNSDDVISIIDDICAFGTNCTVFIEKMISELRNIAIDIKLDRCEYDLDYDDVISFVLDLNECLSSINISVDPYIVLEILILKYVKSSSSSSVVMNKIKNNNIEESGNNSVVKRDEKEDEEVKESHEVDSVVKENVNKDILGNNIDSNTDSSDLNENNEKKQIDVVKIDLEVRINNTFVKADKKYKAEFSSTWVDFLNELMSKDRNLMSLLADVDILAVSDTNVLIQSKQDNVNDLINSSISKIEKMYFDVMNKNYRFAAINEKLWEKEVEKYRFNLKNKIKYTYMYEKENEVIDSESDVLEETNDIEELVKSVFDSYEVK